MNYELKSSIRKNKISLPIKVLIIIAFIIFILYIFVPSLFSSLLLPLANPLWSIRFNISTTTYMVPEGAKDLIIDKLNKENEELKSLLGRASTSRTILAYILKKPPFTAYDSYIIDIGSNNNVKKGDKVYLYGNILVGEISEVYGETSKVLLYSSFGQKYDVIIGSQNIQATATGRGGGAFEAILPRDVKVSIGDQVNIPDITNAVFGTVIDIISEPANVYSTIVFSQPINIYEQKWVQIHEENKSN